MDGWMDGEWNLWGLYCALFSDPLCLWLICARAHDPGLLCLLDCMTHPNQIRRQAMVGEESCES
jgi:hypothetical protein